MEQWLLVQQLSTWQRTVSLDLALDWRVLAFTAPLAGLSALIAGVAPALGLKTVDPGETLKDSGRGIAGDDRFSVRGTLVVAQIALSFAWSLQPDRSFIHLRRSTSCPSASCQSHCSWRN